MFAFMACADPGGEILTVEPLYTNYRSFAAMAGLSLRPILACMARMVFTFPRAPSGRRR